MLKIGTTIIFHKFLRKKYKKSEKITAKITAVFEINALKKSKLI